MCSLAPFNLQQLNSSRGAFISSVAADNRAHCVLLRSNKHTSRAMLSAAVAARHVTKCPSWQQQPRLHYQQQFQGRRLVQCQYKSSNDDSLSSSSSSSSRSSGCGDGRGGTTEAAAAAAAVTLASGSVDAGSSGSGGGGGGKLMSALEVGNFLMTVTNQPNVEVSFAVPPVATKELLWPEGHPDEQQVLTCRTIRDMLQPRPSPLQRHNNWDGNFVSDGDSISINTLKYASPTTSGAQSSCFFDTPKDSWCIDMAKPAAWLDQQDSATPCTQSPPAAAAVTAVATEGPGSSQQGLHELHVESLTSADQGTNVGSVHIPNDELAAWDVPLMADALGQDDSAGPSIDSFDYPPIASPAAATAAAAAEVPAKSPRQLCVRLPPLALRAGARDTVYFDPQQVTAAIVTTGRVCPGINDVIENIVRRLGDYSVPEGQVLGLRHGYRGFWAKDSKPLMLTRASTEGIHLSGGSVLGTSSHDPSTVDQVLQRIETWGINMLFVISGHFGTRFAYRISEGCRERGLPCCVVGVPKSTDNDMLLMDKCFGFDTAVEELQRALLAAKTEAASFKRGIGLVKVMGRHSGILDLQASLASGVVDVCLIPEVEFKLDGPNGVLAYVEKLIESQGHAVIVVSEGAGQHLLPQQGGGQSWSEEDIAVLLKRRLKQHIPGADVKYIDPTYMIQAVVPNSADHLYCKVLAYHAVDAAFAGYTGVTVGQLNSHFVLLPMPVVAHSVRRVDPQGQMWNRLRAANRQPTFQD